MDVQYLSGEDATEADDDQDVKDSRAHNGSYAHIALCDKHPWKHNQESEIIRTISKKSLIECVSHTFVS